MRLNDLLIAAFIVGGDWRFGLVQHPQNPNQSHVHGQAKYLTDLPVNVLSCGYVGAAVSVKGMMTGSKGDIVAPQGCEKGRARSSSRHNAIGYQCLVQVTAQGNFDGL